MRIHNSDGGEVEACGNAARCVARLVMQEQDTDSVLLETAVDVLRASATLDEQVTIDMGPPRLDWREIPLASPHDTLHIPLKKGSLSDPAAVNMGNPHAVFFVDDVTSVPLDSLGPNLEINPIFPDRANIGVAQIIDRNKIRLRVWERGAGLTLACGTGACAALVAAHQRKLCDREAEIQLDGGVLQIQWQDNNHIMMTGPALTAFVGEIDSSLLL
jgi:diaminopimelate epimerase